MLEPEGKPKVVSDPFLYTLYVYLYRYILIIFTLCLILIHRFFLADLPYKSGLVGNAFYALGFLPWILLFWGVLILFFIFVIIVIVCTIIKTVKARKKEWLKLSLTILPLLVLLGYFLPNSFSNKSSAGAWDFLRGYEKWVEKNVDTSAIQEWLISLPPKYSGQYYFEATDFPEELPDAITKFNPYHMSLSEFKDGQRQIEFEWGGAGAFGHFGIVIGLPGMETPKEGEVIKRSESEWEFRRPVQSGIYIFYRS